MSKRYTFKEIAHKLEVSISTVRRWLKIVGYTWKKKAGRMIDIPSYWVDVIEKKFKKKEDNEKNV